MKEFSVNDGPARMHPDGKPRKAGTSFRQKAALVFGSLVIGLLLLELGLRLAGMMIVWRQEKADRGRLQLKSDFRIMCVGESTTYLGGEDSYPSQLEKALNEMSGGFRCTVINKGIPATTTFYILNNIGEWLDEARPDMVIAMMGVNDSDISGVYRGREGEGPLPTFFRNLRILKLGEIIGAGWTHRWNSLRSKLSGRTGATPAPAPDTEDDHLLEPGDRRPGEAEQWVRAGHDLLRQEKRDEAAKAFRRASEHDPQSAEAWLGLGTAQRQKSDFESAESALTTALRLNPASDRALEELGICYLDQRPRDLEKARRMFSRAAELNPASDRTRVGLAFCLWKSRKYRRAKEAIREIMKNIPSDPWTLTLLLYFHQKMRDYEGGIAVCQRALEGNPQCVWALANLAYFYGRQGKTELAEEYSRRNREVQTTMNLEMTVRNYRAITEIIQKRGIQFVAMQYPLRSLGPLKEMLRPYKGIIFVDNERIFPDSGQRYFKDRFAGDFGHCTHEGNQILADNLARILREEYFRPRSQSLTETKSD
jgi:tetratricopeptide (TPR) repeat protein